MIATAMKVCSRCSTDKPVTAFPPRYPWCRECKRVADRQRARRVRGSKPQVVIDHEAVCTMLRAGVAHGDIAREVGCARSTVRAIASRNGLLRTERKPTVERPAWKIREARCLVHQHGGDVVAAALEAYRRTERWREDLERRRGPGSQHEFRDVTAEDVVDVAVTGWRGRVRLLGDVLRAAKDNG